MLQVLIWSKSGYLYLYKQNVWAKHIKEPNANRDLTSEIILFIYLFIIVDSTSMLFWTMKQKQENKHIFLM